MRYKRKSEFIDAMQYDCTNGNALEKWSNHWIYFDKTKNRYVGRVMDDVVALRDEDYVIKGTDGSISICPKTLFENSYVPAYKLTFSEALMLLKDGKKIRRASWKPETYLTITSGVRDINRNVSYEYKFVCMCNKYTDTGGLFTYSWSPISADMFAEDWEVIE